MAPDMSIDIQTFVWYPYVMSRVSAVTRQEGPSLLALLAYLAEGSRQRSPQAGSVRAHLSLLTGPSLILDVGTTLAGQVALGGHLVLYVDGANAFDPYILARLAKTAGQDPKTAMQHLRLSRAFTCHQLETLIAERLPAAIAQYRPGLVVISGWSHLFHDENVPAPEAFRILQNTARRIRSLAAAGQPILATHPDEPVTPRLPRLRAMLVHAADGVIGFRQEEGLMLVTREKPLAALEGAAPGAMSRSLMIPLEDCRPWIRIARHQEMPAAYPWSGR
jgi:hypothetical protein